MLYLSTQKLVIYLIHTEEGPLIFINVNYELLTNCKEIRQLHAINPFIVIN